MQGVYAHWVFVSLNRVKWCGLYKKAGLRNARVVYAAHSPVAKGAVALFILLTLRH